MANTLILDKPYVNIGLDTMTYTILQAVPYSVRVQLTEVPPSGLSVVINNNGSPIFTAPALSPTQIAQQFKVGFLPAVNDVITVVLSSAVAIDAALNSVKSTISITQGF